MSTVDLSSPLNNRTECQAVLLAKMSSAAVIYAYIALYILYRAYMFLTAYKVRGHLPYNSLALTFLFAGIKTRTWDACALFTYEPIGCYDWNELVEPWLRMELEAAYYRSVKYVKPSGKLHLTLRQAMVTAAKISFRASASLEASPYISRQPRMSSGSSC